MSDIFGQTPADVSGALFQHNNLADVPDKELARENLNVPSKEEVLYAGNPLGSILPFLGNVAPAGYLPCYGQTITSTSFPALVEFLNPGGSTAVIPDMRGEFLRGWDDGRGVDLGRALRSAQGGSMERHNHFLPTGSSSTSNAHPTLPDSIWANQNVNPNPTVSTEATTYPNPKYDSRGTEVGNMGTFSGETRPRNIAVLYCIKAYSAVENISYGVNIPGLISEYSALSADAARISYFLQNQSLSATGYQKFPGGLILQWGQVSFTAAENLHIGGKSVTFPITFPNACLSVCSDVNSGVTNNIETSTARISTSSSFIYYAYSVGTTSTYSITSYTGTGTWIAIGY